jgi:small-conductance mechanosensitive channel
MTVFFVLLWLLWVESAMWAFWLLAIIVGLPLCTIVLQMAVNNVFRPPGSAPEGNQVPSVLAAIVERGLRAALIIGAIAFLASKLGVDFTAMTAQDTLLTRLLRGLLSAIIILLTANFLWHVVKTLIESKIMDASKLGETGTEAARRRDRTRTLLPIARNMLMIVIAVVAVLMALSSLGVEIVPLIAGAGILGVAIGFGAQTVVKDIISGVFYLLDDAFRVGEYIQSGSYKGTVESFSLRSVKLRHQRGSIFTVPFSDLGAIQNMSRDWVIEKITLSITYDSDVDKARKIVKKIGLELAQDPEFTASTIQPLKMQGIDEFGDSGMLLRMKIMTKPGEQFTIKRRALMLIKQAFDENGIKIAVPTVQVSGNADSQGAAANAVRLKKIALAAAPPAD